MQIPEPITDNPGGMDGRDANEKNDSTESTLTIAQSWRSFLQPWWKATLAILPAFLVTRFIFLILTYFGGILFTLSNYWPGSVAFHDIVYGWDRWDAVRFATIASQGYVSQDYAAFFPLFPALEHALSALIHKDVVLCGIIISNVAFLATLIVLYRLVETEFDREIAGRTVLYLSIFPTALFFFAGYNESLFLLFMLLCFYALRRRAWWLAGLFGGLATLTRSIGLALFVIFLCEFARLQGPVLWRAWREKKLLGSLRSLTGLIAVLLIPLGLGVYAYGLQKRFGDPLAFTHAQVHWREGLTAPWEAPLQALKFIIKAPHFGFFVPHNIIDLTALLLFLVLLALAVFGPVRFARSQWTFIVFGLIVVIYPLFFPGIPGAVPTLPYDPLPSMQRLVLEAFAGFIVLARLGSRRWFHDGYLLLALPMLAFFTLQFITGHWTI